MWRVVRKGPAPVAEEYDAAIEAGRPVGAGPGRSAPCGRERTMNQVLDFVPIWTLILGMAVFFYVVLDGFDLGVGMSVRLRPGYRRRAIRS